MLDFPAASGQQEKLVVGHLGTLVSEVWEAWHSLRPPSKQELIVALKVHFRGLRPVF